MADISRKGDAPDLGAILKLARTKPMNVAMVIGKDGLTMTGDPRKAPEVMWREAKALAGGSKGGMGVCNVVGKEIQIQFVDDYPATLKKAFKDKLRKEGLKFKPVFISPDGTSDGSDDEEEAPDADGTNGEAAKGDGEASDAAAMRAENIAKDSQAPESEKPADDVDENLKQDLAAEYESFRERLKAVKETSPANAVKKLAVLEGMFLAQLEQAPRKALAALSLLKKTTDAFAPKSADIPVHGPDAGARKSNLASLEKSVDALLAAFV